MNQNNMNEEDVIDLAVLFRALLQKWWLIGICAFLGGVAALGMTMGFIAPKFQSQATLYILSKTTSVTSLADIQLGSALTADFEAIATSKPVIDGAIAQLAEQENKTFTREEISGMLEVSNTPGTRMLVIKATSTSPTDACIVANAIAGVTANQMAAIMKSDPPTTVEFAEAATEPVSPSKTKNTLMGILLGLVLSCGVIVVQSLLNDNIKSEEDVEKYLGLNTLVVVPVFRKPGTNKAQELKELKAGQSSEKAK